MGGKTVSGERSETWCEMRCDADANLGFREAGGYSRNAVAGD